jgi:glutamine cyclotransferase
MTTDDDARAQPVEVVREYGPFPGVDHVRGVTYDGSHVWFAANSKLHALDPETGQVVRTLAAACDAGTAFDGTHLFQIANARIYKIDPRTGTVVSSIPAPGHGEDAGLTWADGALWVGQYRSRRIYKVDPETGAILRAVESNRFVTGVTWVEGELWHATAEAGASEVRRVDPETGAVLTRLEMPEGQMISGLEANGRDLLFCGGATSGKLRAVRRPRRKR